MPHPTRTTEVPLNVWPLGRRNNDGPALRLDLAAYAIGVYTAAHATFVDLELDNVELALATMPGRADLVLALPPAGRLAPPRPWAPPAQAVATQATALLRVGGYLVVAIIRSGSDDLGATVAACEQAGLDYFQHAIGVTPGHLDLRDDARPAAHVDVLAFRKVRP